MPRLNEILSQNENLSKVIEKLNIDITKLEFENRKDQKLKQEKIVRNSS